MEVLTKKVWVERKAKLGWEFNYFSEIFCKLEAKSAVEVSMKNKDKSTGNFKYSEKCWLGLIIFCVFKLEFSSKSSQNLSTLEVCTRNLNLITSRQTRNFNKMLFRVEQTRQVLTAQTFDPPIVKNFKTLCTFSLFTACPCRSLGLKKKAPLNTCSLYVVVEFAFNGK